MRTHLFSSRSLALAAFAIVFTGLAVFLFTERPSAQKVADGETIKTEQAAPETGMISGTVYIDFNMNGVRNTSGIEPDFAVDDGIGPVTVSAYAANGASVTTTTAANGAYSLDTTSLPAGPYRIEFTNLPVGYYPSYVGTNNATTVRMVPDGTQSGIDLGIISAAEEYCQSKADVVTPRWQNGLASGNMTPSMTSVPWQLLGRDRAANLDVSSINDIGTTWATAYKKNTKVLFTTAFLRRNSGLGPEGVGGVYALDFSTPSVSMAGSFDLHGVTPMNGGPAIDLGTITRTDTTGPIAAGAAGDYQLSEPWEDNRDLDAFAKVGKVSFGDAEFESNMQYLWIVNLNQRALIRIDTAVPITSMAATARQWAVVSGSSSATSIGGAPTCTNGVFRPFALKFHKGRGYLGGTCTAENPAGTVGNLSAEILSFNPANISAGLTSEISIPLATTREANSAYQGASVIDATWQPWRDTWNEVFVTGGSTSVEPSSSAPLVSNLEFSQNGSMVLGIMDRVGAQSRGGMIAVSGSTDEKFKVSSGDIHMICRVGSSWVLEGNAGCAVPDNTPFALTGFAGEMMKDADGLANQGEFFPHDIFFFEPSHPLGGGHAQISLGGLALHPGSDHVVSASIDPVSTGPDPGAMVYVNWSQGLVYYDTVNGSRYGYPATDRWAHTDGGGYLMVQFAPPSGAGLGKAVGIGEPEIMCNVAPLQIGNRVWRDNDLDGVQDPNEPAIAGVTVRLYRSGILVGTTTTDSNGNYIFSGVNPNTPYQIRFDNPSDYSSGGPLFGLNPTTPNKTGQAGDDDSNDSDAVSTVNPLGSPAGTFPVISVTTAGPGQNNHTLDGGFYLTPTAAEVSVTGRVLTANGTPIRNASVILTESDGTTQRYTTGSFGYFIFTGVEAGQTVLVDVSAGKRTFSVPTMVVNVSDNVSEVNFYANELR